MTKEEIQIMACNVIANAGEAFDCFVRAVDQAKIGNFDDAEKLLKKGGENLVKAHQAQTDLLNAEMRGEDIPLSILVVHSQDHLMHATTYEKVAADMIDLYKKI